MGTSPLPLSELSAQPSVQPEAALSPLMMRQESVSPLKETWMVMLPVPV